MIRVAGREGKPEIGCYSNQFYPDLPAGISFITTHDNIFESSINDDYIVIRTGQGGNKAC
jgi:hypothetical protein